MLKRFVVFSFVLMFSMIALAQEESYVIIHLTNGTKHTYIMRDKVMVEWSSDSLMVSSRSMTTTYSRSLVRKYTFDKIDIPDHIDNVGDEASFSLNSLGDGCYVLQGIKAGTNVYVYSNNGVEVLSRKVSYDGEIVDLSLRDYPHGVYLIRIPNIQTIKVVR